MRAFYLLFLLFCLSLPSLAQEDEPLPFAYVKWLPDEEHHDLVVMDANSGEMMFEYASDEEDCWTFFPDSQSFLYRQLAHLEGDAPADYFLLNLDTGESHQFAEGLHNVLLMESSDNQLAYHDYENHTIYLYNQTNDETMRVDYVDPSTLRDWRFVEDELFFVSNNELRIYLQRWSNGELETRSLDRLTREGALQIKISPMANYLTIVYSTLDSLYLMDAVTGRSEKIDETRDYRGHEVHWQPAEETGFAYIADSGEVRFYDMQTEETETLLDPGEFYDYDRLFWSPDGRYLAAIAGYDTMKYIHVVDMETGEVLRLPYAINTFHGVLEWISPEQFAFSHAVAFGAATDIYLYDMENRELQQMTETPEYSEYLRCSVG